MAGRQAHKGIKRPRSWGKRVKPAWMIWRDLKREKRKTKGGDAQ